jgi:hypothetical protein
MINPNQPWREVNVFDVPRGIEWRVPRDSRNPVIDRSFVVLDGMIYRRTFDRSNRDLQYHCRALTERELSLSNDELLERQSVV